MPKIAKYGVNYNIELYTINFNFDGFLFLPYIPYGDVVKLFFWVSFYYIFKKTKAFHFKSKAFLFYSDKFPKNQKLFVLNWKFLEEKIVKYRTELFVAVN